MGCNTSSQEKLISDPQQKGSISGGVTNQVSDRGSSKREDKQELSLPELVSSPRSDIELSEMGSNGVFRGYQKYIQTHVQVGSLHPDSLRRNYLPAGQGTADHEWHGQ